MKRNENAEKRQSIADKNDETHRYNIIKRKKEYDTTRKILDQIDSEYKKESTSRHKNKGKNKSKRYRKAGNDM